jgi:SpoVK/Ycf46/Vps4 family AAA+-type ATPase
MRPPIVADFGDVLEPSEAAEPILARPVRNALLEWLTEIWAEAELTAVGLQPRRKALFDGVPGVGKTTLAHHLAARLGLPMAVIRPERLIDKWVGSTARNIGDLFDAAAEAQLPYLLFFDEFDAVAIQRRQADQGAEDERNSFVNTLLQRIEQYEGYLIAATNFGKHIDKAVWRRFDIQITLELPGRFERERILARYLSPYGLPSRSLGALADAFETAPPSLIRQWCEGIKRQLIIGPKVGWNMAKEAVIERLLASIHPHPDVGKPRLWSLGLADPAVPQLPWPLSLATDLPAETAEPIAAVTASDSVVPLRARR